MCIYCGTTKYRKIWIKHNGLIPKDEQGYSYEIHHIDGDRQNNTLDNLACVSIREHYDVHYIQGDWAACVRIGAKLKISSEELREISILNCAKTNARTLKNGTHNFLGENNHVHAKVANGTYHTLGPSHNLRLLANGRHASQKLKYCPHCLQTCDSANYSRYHGDNCAIVKPRTKYTCMHCGIHAAKHMISRYHNDKCKNKD